MIDDSNDEGGGGSDKELEVNEVIDPSEIADILHNFEGENVRNNPPDNAQSKNVDVDEGVEAESIQPGVCNDAEVETESVDAPSLVDESNERTRRGV